MPRGNEYVWIDLDNWRVFPVIKRGIVDRRTGTLTFTYDYPQIGGQPMRIMEIVKKKGPDAFQIENLQLLPGGSLETGSTTVYRREAS